MYYTYITPKQVSSPKDYELSILSMNIRSILKNIEHINDSITEYTIYGVINLNETSCNISKLADGLDDLEIEGFYPPVYQAPARKSCRGGGLLTYVNKRVCSSAEDIQNVNFDQYRPSQLGAFLVTKIQGCLKYGRTI